MMETQQTPGRLAAALTAGFRSTWTLAITDGCPEGLGRGDRRVGCLVRRRFPRLFRVARALSGFGQSLHITARTFRSGCPQRFPEVVAVGQSPPDG